MEEIWKDVVGYEGFYQVSNLGRVKSFSRLVRTNKGGFRLKNENILRAGTSSGYLTVLLCVKAKNVSKTVHRLVCEAFLSNPQNKPHVNHKNSIRNDNRLENLEWCTAKENVIHSFEVGNRIPLRGNKQWASKLTEEKVLKIRELLSNGVKRKLLPDIFGVTKSTISDIAHDRIWRHLI